MFKINMILKKYVKHLRESFSSVLTEKGSFVRGQFDQNINNRFKKWIPNNDQSQWGVNEVNMNDSESPDVFRWSNSCMKNKSVFVLLYGPPLYSGLMESTEIESTYF